jgi:homoserine O-acetyltransferase
MHTLTLTEPMILQSGAVLNSVSIAYELFGELNSKKSNAILLCHALTGDSHVSSSANNSHNGWWQEFVGPNKTVDTNKYCVICVNILGSCLGSTGPISINPDTQKAYNLSFPIVTISDMVFCQKKVVDYLEISQLYAVIGPSMGGMQALKWVIDYPLAMKRCVIIAASASLSPQALAFGTVARQAITSDKLFKNGEYSSDEKPVDGLSIARMIGHITYLSKKSLDIKFGRKLQEKSDYGFKLGGDFQVESYLSHQGDKFVDRFDANSYLYLSKALSYFDLEKEYGSLEKAFESVQAKLLIISISSDWLYSPEQIKESVHVLMKLNKAVSYSEVFSDYGHDAFLVEPDKFSDLVEPFLEAEYVA